ncbi:MAG: 16S rRNA (cytidine(1402)-2'-O)-methyltransferase [Chloroflexota bacterium]|nr:16S rRNA (cytidine(1402)-2'-O)-methyltransferase [Chloroflexota bacterium]MDE2840400.1 16S rRNA (cytidine(1402)-2'-O)-methyltransferase [Chloroflexota bacterium]MDE2931284.1 16S rRNA (cytidine(1402)-2'-O)-methyltransferase [Chloroflexota bacterium]
MAAMRGLLYVVATPIGNLEDITLRAVRVLREVDVIAAEDTRHTRKLLAHLDIHTPLTSFHAHSGTARMERILRTLEEGKSVALVTDAGTPGIADPGQPLIAAAVEKGIPVVPMPGPTAVATAVSVAGFPGSMFCFLGFLPGRPSRRKRLLESVAELPFALVIYASPYRLLEDLETCRACLGNRDIVVARELTKVHEEVLRGTTAEMLEHFEKVQPRGEFTLVVRGMGVR